MSRLTRTVNFDALSITTAIRMNGLSKHSPMFCSCESMPHWNHSCRGYPALAVNLCAFVNEWTPVHVTNATLSMNPECQPDRLFC